MAAMELCEVYKVGVSEKVKEAEAELAHELTELRTELEEVDLPPKTTSSVPIPENKEHFKQERKFVIQRALEVSEAHPVRLQADEMKQEMEAAEESEYTTGSLPLLLHQHFTERIQHLIHLKHQHMLRWKRFCEHSSTIENLYPLYSQRLTNLLNEYKDCVQRAQRLSSVRESLMLERSEASVSALNMEDLLIYLRWLVCHLHSMKRFNQYLKVLQWLPISHKTDIAPPGADNADKEEATHASKIASRYQDDMFHHGIPGSSRPTSAQSGHSLVSPIPSPPPINPALLTTSPLPASAMLYAAAAAGGGLASDEHMLIMPIHTMDFDSFRPQLAFLVNVYAISFDLSSVHNSADEMEMFGAVNRRFKHIFVKQEHLNSFKTYDRIEPTQDTSSPESPNHALRKEANWCSFISLHAERDPQQEKMWTQLHQRKHVDELLRVQAHFVKVTNAEKVQDTLKEHATQVRNPPIVAPASVTSHPTPNNTSTAWKKIYSNPDLYTESDKDDAVSLPDIDERDVENVNFGGNSSRTGSARKRRDSYDYVGTVQMLGLDDGEQDKSDPVTAQGAYLSYLHLRHLRIRDLQRSCLSVLNYFRSIERTLTINDMGLASDGEDMRQSNSQNHRNGTDMDGSVGGGGSLGSHGYIHNTPADFKMSESDFVQFSEVENHDDFYNLEEGRVHVLDQRGYYIIYDKALDDFRTLESDLMLVASHYIEKDRDLRSARRLRTSSSARQHVQSAGDFDIPSYAHQDVDRFGVLMDIWTNQTAFLECKRELLDCYFEAYQHVVDREERRSLAQVITNIMHQRPRFDLEAEYFVRMYRAECSVLRHHTALVKTILDKQIESQREFTQRVTREGDHEFGLPNRIIPKQPIAVNLSRPALKNVYMLEFHPSLAIASRIPTALKHAYWELHETHQPDSAYAALMMEKKLLQVALKEWEGLPMMGTSFSMQVQKDLFSDMFAEDPLFQCELAQHCVQQQDQKAGRRTHKEKQVAMVKMISRLMEVLTLRQRMIDACWETEILAKIYKKQASEMGYPDYHMNMRFVQFEFASYKEKAGKAPPIFITAVQEDDTAVDKYTPSCLYLAIHELDEGHVGRFTFRSRDGVLQVMRPGGMESFQVVLKAQILQRNALAAGVLQASICNPVKVKEWKSGRASPTETKSEKSSVTQMTGMSSGTAGTVLAGKLSSDTSKSHKAPEAFFSLQLEKTPSRDLMLNEFVTRKQQMGSVLRNPDELERVKRKLLSDFCHRFHLRVAQASMRAQLLAYYTSILTILEAFPSLRESYFVMGEPNEKKSKEDCLDGLSPDPRLLKKRPRRLLSEDGQHVLNLWFIPHHTEVLVMFKTLDDDSCARAMSFALSIVAALHDMLQYLSAHAKLGSSHARMGSQKVEFVSADWGGTEGIGSELRDIQKQIQNLPEPTDPQLVLDLLNLRRDVMFLEFDTAVRTCMADTFLSTGNMQAYESIVNNAHYALSMLSRVQRPSLSATYLTIPEPLEARDLKAKQLFPWRCFLGQNGPYPIAFWQWFKIESYVSLCLAGLKDVDRHVANGEILGVTLLMEDVLQTGFLGSMLTVGLDSQAPSQTESVAGDHADTERSNRSQSSVLSDLKEASKALAVAQQQRSLSRTQQPLEAYRLLRFFLLLWKCLEMMKLDWGKRKLMVEKINSTVLYKEFCKTYRMEILLPVLQSVARRLGQGDLYDSLILDTDVYVMPKGASEIEVRLKQLLRLLESLETHMISEVRKRVSKELTLAVAERAREEEALPTDLWKRAVMKESFTMNRPHVAEKFVNQLMSQAKEEEDSVTFTSEHLQTCLSELARNVMAREKHSFESYSMYYENLLRVHHQLLYQKEQDIRHLKDQLRQAQADTRVSVQCELANEAHDLLMEITALRAKIVEMREMSMSQERDIRERVREEYNDLIQNIFNSTFQLRGKFDEFRNDLHDDVFEKINETRREAASAMSKLQQKFRGVSNDEELQANLSRAEQIRSLQNENHHLNQLILKMKAMNSWRQNVKTHNFLKTTSDLRKKAEGSKKDHLGMKMLAEEEVVLLRQQLVAIRKALTSTEKDCNEVRKVLQREQKVRSEREHEEAQKERSKTQLEQAKQAIVDRLADELLDKDSRLKKLEDEQDRVTKMAQISYEKTRRDAETVRKQLNHERSLKLDAFQRVDTLQSQVYDYESCLLNRPPSVAPAAIGKPRSRATSAQMSRRSRPSTGGGNWPPPISWPANRSLTPMGDVPLDVNAPMNNELKKIQRPKTVGGRLRSRIAEQLLNELEPDTHRTIVQLEQLQIEAAQGSRRDKY
ncbi:uncharacterized protein LOC101845475 [Aplysia californica]|uniref:Uncharacterized protein LOC101845475 n=1 Tax=Aplysia californica TaxID=6500 RepID=A0ABM1A2P4_APLCA|nr:uncharacterized protein LOC101845475 [Aplysia californica]